MVCGVTQRSDGERAARGGDDDGDEENDGVKAREKMDQKSSEGPPCCSPASNL